MCKFRKAQRFYYSKFSKCGEKLVASAASEGETMILQELKDVQFLWEFKWKL